MGHGRTYQYNTRKHQKHQQFFIDLCRARISLWKKKNVCTNIPVEIRDELVELHIKYRAIQDHWKMQIGRDLRRSLILNLILKAWPVVGQDLIHAYQNSTGRDSIAASRKSSTVWLSSQWNLLLKSCLNVSAWAHCILSLCHAWQWGVLRCFHQNTFERERVF